VVEKKIMSLKEAVKKFVFDGAHICLGGCSTNRNPMAVAYEIIRQKKRNLYLYMHTAGIAIDILIGAGCIRGFEQAYTGMGRFAPIGIRFRKAIEGGAILYEDYTNYQMGLRFLAGAMGVPFLPTLSGLGTDILKKWGIPSIVRRKDPKIANRKLIVMGNPFSNRKKPENLVLVPAINPDLAIIHAHQVDTEGTIRIKSLTFTDVEMAKSAKHLLVTCEEIVNPDYLRKSPEQNQIPFFITDAIVKVPYGAHPTACFGCYDYDTNFLKIYHKAALIDSTFKDFLEEYVFLESHNAYLRKIDYKKFKKS